MASLKNILNEEYRKKVNSISPQGLMNIVEEMVRRVGSVKTGAEHFLKEEEESSPASARRGRVLRLPIQFPTEISVGQTPGDPDRQIFEDWMSRIAPEGDLAAKIKSIENYIHNPPELPVADTLSYLMFLNTFAFMLQEFNASVAGFLWEPFLAALFGDDSVQVPTSEHDIADVKLRIRTSKGGLARVSLKILREKGAVGGSFVDLVRHFAANPDQPMIYVVIKKFADDTVMKFFEFPLSQETFFNFIGHPKLKKITKSVDFAVPEDFPSVRREDLAAFIEESGEIPSGWKLDKKSPTQSVIVDASSGAIVNSTGIQPGQTYSIQLISLEKRAQRAAVGVTLAASAKNLWGPPEDYARWFGLYEQMQQGGIAPADFWEAVLGNRPDISPQAAHGIRNKEQFEIAWNVLEDPAFVDHIGSLDISKEALDASFANGSQAIGVDLTDLFNAMTDLVDDVGRFFLIDCGDPAGAAKKCTPDDEKTRTQSGTEAVEEANLIQRVVNEKIASQLQSENKA